MLKKIRYFVWATIVSLILLLSIYGLGGFSYLGKSTQTTLAASIGGPFTMVNMAGNSVTQKDLIGRKHAIFFGFTSCPDVCPITMQDLTAALNKIPEEKAQDLDIIFVSVDHERDTPDFLGNYLSIFDSHARIRGLTGTKEQIADMAKAYRIYYKKHELDDGDYTYDHTSTTLLFDQYGQFEGTIAYGEKLSVIVQKLKNLLSS